MNTWQTALVDFDVGLARKLWACAMPHLPQPKSHAEMVIMLHIARTAAESVPLHLRQYSHGWLVERKHPSQLPPKDQPVIAEGVGISVNSKYPEIKRGIQGAMEYAVMDCYANGDNDPEIVRAQMKAARDRERKGFGIG